MLSIIIPCLNEGKKVEAMIANINQTIGIDDYEVIIVNSGGTDLSTMKGLRQISVYQTEREGAPQARNFGASKANGEALVFADAHAEFQMGWGPKMMDSLSKVNGLLTPGITATDDKNAKGFGYTWINPQMDIQWLPGGKSEVHDVPFACACCTAVNKKTFQEIGGFDGGTRFWGSEDSELSLRAWLLGFKVMCDPSIQVGHVFRQEHPYHVAWFDELYNKVRLAFSHFSPRRLENFLWSNSQAPMFLDVLLDIQKSSVFERRAKLFKARVNSDDWFFEKFKMPGWS